MKAFSYYDILIKNTKDAVETEKQKYQVEEMTPFYEFNNDIRILSAAGKVSEVFLNIHNLSHYKVKHTDIEIGVSIKTCIESLMFSEVKGGYFSLMRDGV